MHVSNIIIAGANKAGTTSLFRYLADHPEVCPSSIKETDFFFDVDSITPANVLDQYGRYFSACGDSASVWLEASPGYLAAADDVAERICRFASGAKLIFCLRDPVQRLLSYYLRNLQTQFHPGLAALDIEEFVSLLEDVVGNSENIPQSGAPRNALLQYERGRYATHLTKFSHYFPDNQILILTFDELVANTPGTVKMVSRFIGVSETFYDDYTFTIENQTRDYRFKFLQKTGSKWAKKMEVLLNKAPWIRKALRKSLLRQSPQRGSKNVSNDIRRRMTALYETPNAELKKYLAQTHPEVKLPDWLL